MTNNNEDWEDSEEEIAERLDGYVRPGSGSIEIMKGDVITDIFLIEVKTRQEDKKYVSQEMMEKIYWEAQDESRKPAIALNFKNSNESDYWIMISGKDFIEIEENIECLLLEDFYVDVDTKGKGIKQSNLTEYCLKATHEAKYPAIHYNFKQNEVPVPCEWVLFSFDWFEENYNNFIEVFSS